MNANQEIKEYDSRNFESLKYSLVNESNDILLDDACDPGSNFFSKNIKNLDTTYLYPEEFQDFLEKPAAASFSVLHLNIRSIKKNFENFKKFLSSLGFTFSIICFSETWLDILDNKTYDMICQITLAFIKRGAIVKVEECLFMFITLLFLKLDLIYL